MIAPKTLEDLSAKYGISRERVRQIEVRAFDKLQKAMKNMVVEAANRSGKQQLAAAAHWRPVHQPASRALSAFFCPC